MSKDTEKILETLLSELTEKNYEFLISLEKLRENGWQIHHIIDADIIGNYCFPAGILSYNRRKAWNRELTDEYLIDEQATLYYHLITTDPPPQGIILDEYIHELKAMTKVAQKAARSAHDESLVKYENWESQLKKTNLEELDFQELLRDVENHLAQRVAEVTFGIPGLQKFYTLLSEKRIIFEDSEILGGYLNVFDDEKGNVHELEELRNILSDKKFNSDSRDRDLHAIQRVISINRHIQNKFKETEAKNLFLFFIDAPSSTQEMFDKIIESSKIDSPLVEGSKFRLYITTQELFAFLICRKFNDNNEEDYFHTISELNLLKDKSIEIQKKLRDTSEAIGKIREDDIQEDLLTGEYNNFFKNYKSIRNNVENIGLFNNIGLLYKNIELELKDRKATHLLTYFRQIHDVENKLLEEFATKDKLLNKLLDEVNFNSIYITGIESIRYSKKRFEWSKGDDEIEGTYQILPIFLQLNYYPGFEEAINKIIKFVLGEEKMDDTEIYENFKKLISKLSRVRSKSEYPIKERLLKALIFLILPSSSRRNSYTNSISKDDQVLNWLQKIQNNNENIADFEADLLYILCWVTRRKNNHPDSLGIAKKGIREFPNDPRFYHGRGLARYCELITSNTILPEDFDIIIKDIEKAEELYSKFFREHYGEIEAALYLRRLTECNNNSICFFLTEKAALLLDEDYEAALLCLQKARKKLKKLKDENGFLFNLSEYYDTEAYLEYYESFFDDEFDIKSKLVNAKKAIVKALELTINTQLKDKYNRRLNLIEVRLKELASK